MTGGKPIQVFGYIASRCDWKWQVINAGNPSAGALQPFQTQADCGSPPAGLALLAGNPVFCRSSERGSLMVSFWWVMAAFIGGGFAGVLVMALMRMAGGLPRQLERAPDLNGMPWA